MAEGFNPWAFLAEATGYDSTDLATGFRQEGYAMVSLAALRRLGWRGVCQDQTCPCWVPGEVCEEFMGNEAMGTRCPRCGWHKKFHKEVVASE